ncbi:MAG TPA: class I SAM-dependent rRNA methyltransferase [Anaerolineae bacterium]|nr:class I SAM-dependent rRNA methyltransferase [Anaerolineae bacterium]
MPTLTLKPGREKSVRNRHPWLFSGAIQRIDRDAQDGDVVDVYSDIGQWLARGYLNRRSQIQVRLLTWDERQPIDEDFWRNRLQRAIAGRAALAADPQTNAYRPVYAESDGLPGLVVDRYGDWLVVQVLTLGVERAKPLLVRLLVELTQPAGIVERSDVDVRAKEGLRSTVEMLHGQPPAGPVEVLEQGQRFLVDLLGGQKTGFYLDQRENRQRTAAYCQGARVLNAFSYSGGFAVYALAAGAQHVVNLDSSLEALELAERNLALNGFDPDAQAEGVAGDVFQVLRDWRAAGERFDVIILDPPKFAHSQQQVERAARAYKDINLLAMQLLQPGGVLATFSCSGLVSADLFQKILFGASVDAGRDVQVVERLSQGPDHPLLLSFPEGEYLKGLVCRVW